MNDLLGNRVGRSDGASYVWDVFNRMTSFVASSGATTNYLYRADGLRVAKSNPSGSNWTLYDGQMPMQEVDTTGSSVSVTNNGLGARGLDYMSRTTGSQTTVVFPIYDAHGNMVADVSRSGANSFTVNDARTFDVWGQVRSGNQQGDPKGRYCANLGHKQDDESGLIYMRARYYEPSNGRFISQDPSRSGMNYFAYCANDPVNAVDESGNIAQLLAAIVIGFLAGAIADLIYQLANNPHSFMDSLREINWKEVGLAGAAGAATGLILAVGGIGLTALGAALGSELITDIGGAFLALSTAFSPKTLGGLLLGSVCGGIAAAIVNRMIHNLQTQMALQALDEQ